MRCTLVRKSYRGGPLGPLCPWSVLCSLLPQTDGSCSRSAWPAKVSHGWWCLPSGKQQKKKLKKSREVHFPIHRVRLGSELNSLPLLFSCKTIAFCTGKQLLPTKLHGHIKEFKGEGRGRGRRSWMTARNTRSVELHWGVCCRTARFVTAIFFIFLRNMATWSLYAVTKQGSYCQEDRTSGWPQPFEGRSRVIGDPPEMGSLCVRASPRTRFWWREQYLLSVIFLDLDPRTRYSIYPLSLLEVTLGRH